MQLLCAHASENHCHSKSLLHRHGSLFFSFFSPPLFENDTSSLFTFYTHTFSSVSMCSRSLHSFDSALKRIFSFSPFKLCNLLVNDSRSLLSSLSSWRIFSLAFFSSDLSHVRTTRREKKRAKVNQLEMQRVGKATVNGMTVRKEKQIFALSFSHSTLYRVSLNVCLCLCLCVYNLRNLIIWKLLELLVVEFDLLCQ